MIFVGVIVAFLLFMMIVALSSRIDRLDEELRFTQRLVRDHDKFGFPYPSDWGE
jgi:hypothetical protein